MTPNTDLINTKKAKKGRTDVHAPSVVVPEDYEFVAFENIRMDDFGACAVMQDNRARIKAHMEQTKGRYSNHAHGGVCMVCGNANAVYTVLFYHAKTNTYIRMGDNCAQKTEMSYGDISYFVKAIRLQAKLAKGKRAAAEQWKDAMLGRALEIALESRELPVIPGLGYEFNAETEAQDKAAWDAWREREQKWQHGFKLGSMLATTEKHGVLSEKMVSAAKWLADKHDRYDALQKERAAEREVAAPCPTGRVRVEGTVLSVKEHESMFGITTKMTVKAAAGYIIWATVPSGTTVERGQEVAFMATVTPSATDPKFGVGKRPAICK
jgi:hypothetical protein